MGCDCTAPPNKKPSTTTPTLASSTEVKKKELAVPTIQQEWEKVDIGLPGYRASDIEDELCDWKDAYDNIVLFKKRFLGLKEQPDYPPLERINYKQKRIAYGYIGRLLPRCRNEKIEGECSGKLDTKLSPIEAYIEMRKAMNTNGILPWELKLSWKQMEKLERRAIAASIAP
jgi:hypothetical protein